MNLEERVAYAVITKTQAVAPPSIDIDSIRHQGRRRARRRTALTVLAAAALVAGTIWGASTLSNLDQSPEPTQTPSNPDSLRPLTYADAGTIHYGEKTIEVGAELNGLTVTDYGVAFTTQDGRVWFSDGATPEQVGVTSPDVLQQWGFTRDGYAFKEPDWVVAGSTGPYAEWFEFPAPDETEIVVYDTREGEVAKRVPIDVPQDCKGACAQLQGVYDGKVYWTEDPCRPFAATGNECEGQVAPPHVYDLASGTETTMTVDEYADVLRTRPRMIGVRGAPEEGGHNVPLNLSDGTGLADASSNVIFANGGSNGQIDGMSPGGLGEVRYNLATGSQLRFDRPAGFDRNTNFSFDGWLDDETFQLAESRFGRAPIPQIGALLVCRVSSGACEVAKPAPDPASIERIVPNF
jgi:hypothetical protein